MFSPSSSPPEFSPPPDNGGDDSDHSSMFTTSSLRAAAPANPREVPPQERLVTLVAQGVQTSTEPAARSSQGRSGDSPRLPRSSEEFKDTPDASKQPFTSSGYIPYNRAELKRLAFKWDGVTTGERDVEEFLNKIKIMSEGLKLDYEARLCLLMLSVTDGAYSTVSTVLGHSTEPAKVQLEIAQEALRRRYGGNSVKAFKDLHRLQLSDFDSIDAAVVQVRKMVHQSFPDLPEDARDKVCKAYVYHLLPENHSSTAQLLPCMLDSSQSCGHLLHLARNAYDDIMSSMAAKIVATTQQGYSFPGPFSPKGGKGKAKGKGKGDGKGKAKGKGRYVQSWGNPIDKQPLYCIFCDRPGHPTEKCRRLKRARGLLNQQQEGRSDPRSQVSHIPVIRDQSHIFLLDSGAENSIISERVALERNLTLHPAKTIYYTLNDSFTTSHQTTLLIRGVTLAVNVLPRDSLFPLTGRRIDGILGCDFLAEVGQVKITAVRKPQGGKPYFLVSVPQRYHQHDHPPSHNSPRKAQLLGSAITSHEIPLIVTGEIKRKDFTVVRYKRPDGSQFWECSWIWKSDAAKARASRHRPPVYTQQFNKYPPETHKLWREELRLWQEQGYIKPARPEDLASTVTMILVEQLHKTSTPVRPVLDYKPLNTCLLSYPNETEHVTCDTTLRRWRAGYCKDGKLRENWLLSDIRKAYLCIYMAPDCAKYQGVRIVEEDGSISYWELERLAFGVHIAPKVLRAVIDFIFEEEHLDGGVEPFFDDLRVPESQLKKVETALQANGFGLKPPEEAETARVLGLQRTPHNQWTRRAPLTPIKGNTYSHLKSWVATLACSHYPILKWLRPAARAIERLAFLENPHANSDTLLSDAVSCKCAQLFSEIVKQSDPTVGDFTVDPNSQWSLYCDASDLGLGACLFFGECYVEDISWLRKLNDIKPIDTMELEAVLRGINSLVIPWRRALEEHEPRTLHIYTDNKPVLGQLQRKDLSHWKSSKGPTAGSAECRLQIIEDTLSLAKLKPLYFYIDSAHNPADILTRVPPFLRWKRAQPSIQPEKVIAVAITANPQNATWREHSTISSTGLSIPDSHILEFLREIHDKYHDNSEALFHRVRGWVRTVGLRAHCRKIVSSCKTCRASKAHAFQNADYLQVESGVGNKRKRTAQEIAATRRSSVPFNKLHVDVVGPFRHVQGAPQFFVVTCVCNATGYALGKPVRSTPIGRDIVDLLSYIPANFHTYPLVLCSDGGSNIVSSQVTEYLSEHDIHRQVTAKNSSLANGRVERLHRTLEEYIRSHVTCDSISFPMFCKIISDFFATYNTTAYRGTKSAHDRVFSFPSNCEPLRPVQTRPEYDSLCSEDKSTWGIGFANQSPVLLRVFKPANKLARRWSEAQVDTRLGKKTYSLINHPGKFDLKDLKPLPNSTYELPV